MKPTAQQIQSLDKVLKSPAELQKLGAAVVQTMKSQFKAGVEISQLTLPIVDSNLAAFGGPVEDSISVGVNDVVSVSWSHDIDVLKAEQINEEIKGLPAAQQATIINRLIPEGLQGGKRISLAR